MKAKTVKIALKGSGLYLGMEKGCFVIKRKKRVIERYPMFENIIDEIHVVSGNMVSTGVLASCGFWGITVLVKTRRGKPVAVLRSMDDYSHVKTRIAQYESLKNGKGVEIAKAVAYAKLEGQDKVLEHYNLERHKMDKIKAKIESLQPESLKEARKKLVYLEAKATEHYFRQIFTLLPKEIRIFKRKTYGAYDGVNNTFNLAYTILQYRVFIAILKAHLEPFLGYIHSLQFGKPSLVCDFMELYRYLIDHYVIGFCKNLTRKDFILKKDWLSHDRLAKRQVLSKTKTDQLVEGLEKYFEVKVDIPRVKHGFKQAIESLINEEALLLAKYLRGERKTWKPRLPNLPSIEMNI